MPARRPRTQDETERKRELTVRMMASTKTPLKAMAELLGISVAQLRKNYSTQLKTGHDYVYAAVSTKLVSSAMSGDIRASLAWMRQFGGWSEVTRREITGKNGEPISFRSLDAATLTAVIEALRKGENAGRGGGRSPPEIELTAVEDNGDLESIPGPTDEGARE